MAIATYDTQQGATITFGSDSLTLRLTSVAPLRAAIAIIRATYLGTTGDHEYVPGELKDYAPIPVTYQNSPGLANPSVGTVQTITITGPVAPGGSVAESVTGTAFVSEGDVVPGFSSDSENLQMKSITIKFDGFTGPTRTVGS